MQSEAGKGSKQRPTDYSKFSEGWDKIFKKKEVKSWDHYSDLPGAKHYEEVKEKNEG